MRLIQYLPGDRYQTPLIAAQALWYRSPHKHTPETPETLLSYLPKEGLFIGRHKERELLSVILSSDVRRDEGSPLPPITFILGKKGTGKTRMFAWLKPLAQRLGFEICDSILELTKSPTFPPFLKGGGGDYTSEPFDFGPRLRLGRSPQGRRANEQTLVLIDDLHLLLTSDHPIVTIAVEALKSMISRAKIPSPPWQYFIFAFNPDEIPFERALSKLGLKSPHPPFSKGGLGGLPSVHIIELHNFTTTEVSEYLKSLLGEPPDPATVSELYSLTNGNPRYLTDYMEELIKSGRLFSLSGRPDKETLKTIGLDLKAMPAPVSLQEHIISIYEGLPYPTKQLVGLKAILGRPASVDELGRIMPQINVAHELLELIKGGIVSRLSSLDARIESRNAFHETRFDTRIAERETSIVYGFTNPATYHILSTHLSKSAQMELHSLIAAELRGTKDERRRTHRPSSIVHRLSSIVNESIKGGWGDYTAEFLLHLGYGENTPESRRALERLTKYYLSQGRALEAIDCAKELFTRLSSLVPRPSFFVPRPQLAETLFLLGDAYEQARLWNKAIDAYKLLRTTPLWHEGLIRMGLAYSKQRRLTEGRRCLKQALEVVPKGALVERITIKNYLAAIDMREGKFKEAYRQYLNNLHLDKKLPLKVRPANNELGEVLYHMGLHAKAERILKQNLKLHSARRLSERVANTYYLLGLVFKDKSEFSRAYEHFLLARKSAKRHHLFETLLRVESGLGDVAYNEAKFATAVEHYQEGLKLAQQLSAKETSIELIVNLGIAASKCGQLSLAKECLESASEARIAKRHLPAIYTVLADIYFNGADYERAKAVILKARNLEARQKLAPAIRYSIHGTLADIYLAQGRPELARREIPFLKRLANTLPETRAHFKGLLYAIGVRLESGI